MEFVDDKNETIGDGMTTVSKKQIGIADNVRGDNQNFVKKMCIIISNIIRHLGLSLLLATIVLSLSWFTVEMFPSLGYNIFFLVYIMIIGALIYYYNLMTYFGFRKSLLHFILNFVLWGLEQVLISTNFEKTFLYQDENYKALIVVIGGILWTANKLLLDTIFKTFNSRAAEMNKFDVWWSNRKSSNLQ